MNQSQRLNKIARRQRLSRLVTGTACLFAATALVENSRAEAPSDPLLNLMIKKGMVTQAEADQIRAEAATQPTNGTPAMPNKWKINDGTKSLELFGDIRLRYEYRSGNAAGGGGIILDRYRYALRFGVRGELFDNFYYGFRLDTAPNPRSPWVTFGTSSTPSPIYQGPFGKSNAGINVGQAYIGWKPESWVDITVGKMANPLFTTPMVWDTDFNPEGAAERFKFAVGQVDLFATFGQFLYQDNNPTSSSAGLISAFPSGNSSGIPFLLTWQAGFNYHVKDDVTVKAAATLYNYAGHGENLSGTSLSPNPGFADTFVGQGAAQGTTIAGIKAPPGFSGYPNGNANGVNYDGFAANQTGINDLLVLEFPVEVNFKIAKLNARVFGDFADNLQGSTRAQNAFNAAKALGAAVTPINSPAKNDTMAYQIGFAIGNKDSLGLVYGQVAKKGMWEARTYWQHTEQYSLDPNLVDSDFFEGRENMEGVYCAFGYCFANNVIGTLRYGYANRINKNLGTGGSNQDIPQINAINKYQLLQMDMTYRF